MNQCSPLTRPSIFSYLLLPVKAHPLLAAVVALMGGIAGSAHHMSVAVACMCLVALFATINTPKHRQGKTVALACIFFCLGFILHNHQVRHYETLYTITKNKKMDLEGIVTNIISIDNPRFSEIITVKINRLTENRADMALPFCPTVQLYVRNKLLPQISDVIRIEEIQIKKPANEEFNRYLCKEGVHATIFLNNNDQMYIAEIEGFSLPRTIHNLRATLYATLQQKMNYRTFCFFSSIFLGNKHNFKKETDQNKEHFNAWGVSHHFSRSGLHLLIFILMLELLLCFIPTGFIKKQFLIGALCAMYSMLSWSSLGFLRALTMFFIYKACMYAQEFTTAVHGLTLICTCTLLFNPMQLFFLNFQLNFALTFALAWFSQLHAQRKRPFL